jgi:dethiobiotin synthetase
MKKIFITSSGTGIGKTLVTCAVTKALKDSGKNIHTVKPIISGFNPNIVPNDLFYICESLGINYLTGLKKVNFASFKRPLSPDMAARVEKTKEVDFKKLVKFLDDNDNDILVVETSGGIQVPINSKKTTLDLIKTSADVTILVVGSYLGSLSHTLTSYELLKLSKKTPVLLIVTQNMAKSDPLYIPLKETIKSLENFVSVPILAVEKLSGTETAKINKLSKQPKLISLNAKISQLIKK